MSDRPLLYLLAGNGSSAEWWDDVVPCFQRYHVVPLELPGFGDNPQPPCEDLAAYAEALLSMTIRGSAIVAVGVNALLVLHALQRQPGHFSRSVLLSPVGAFLWQRRLPALMSPMPIRKTIHWLLSNKPALFAHKFSRHTWPDKHYQRMGDGYARCRAFVPYWDLLRADTALPLLEWVEDPIELVWGDQDSLLGIEQAAAWSAILARADLNISLKPGWGHYPWIDSPAEFAQWLESDERGFIAHTKGGRLRLAASAGQPVPAALSVVQGDEVDVSGFLASQPDCLWAVRSSSFGEDQADAANAGLSTTYLRESAQNVPARVAQLHAEGVEEVVVQRFITPVLSGIAFVRHLSVELEWVEGHLESLADGQATPQRAIISRLGSSWSDNAFATSHGLTQVVLWDFLQNVLRVFHYVPGDVEWAWDGQQLWLLQYRPISDYGWRRHLTAANIAEILPPQPSRFVEYAQRRAAGSIPAIMGRWDARIFQDNEPFTALFGAASYINNDLFLARLADWGVASRSYAGEVGGATPHLPWRPLRLLRSLPLFLRMQRIARGHLLTLETRLIRFDRELDSLTAQHADGQQLADWFTRFYVFVVQGNLCIATALASSGGDRLGRPATAYDDLEHCPHRLPWETDPATPRPALSDLPLQAFPAWPKTIRLAHSAGLPGMRGYYLQVREWYRDNLMRVFFRLHHAMPQTDRAHWFAPHPDVRARSGSFWQDGREGTEQAAGFMIYPGQVQGILGEDILLEDTLDPGRHAHYQNARAVIARMGGRLSHGSTLLRELRKPSAVLPHVDPEWLGREVRYADGELTLIE
ncbi:alpha/beta hydrolase [Pseudomonas viridiflava]|uniref:alpha/beta hydrolase n=1 Tax=Pseudomonas viridiflava TaxID=33069 RepID=UPI002EB721A6|nr:alpha/beta hydrolase [Pseudomonas viridiflava]MEE3931884.1 alpha/beta hydrolase [Pseudomonas viridiflava]MEE3942614.1 alpha/beta hydrolase [Pseudomonas viridiflava]MEE3970193.1 alpha/beta hydrolase [Pseudomonas viridiflava]MEE3984585.1 alpha/beta hydrolase [Pseudomonas viridiflava]